MTIHRSEEIVIADFKNVCSFGGRAVLPVYVPEGAAAGELLSVLRCRRAGCSAWHHWHSAGLLHALISAPQNNKKHTCMQECSWNAESNLLSTLQPRHAHMY